MVLEFGISYGRKGAFIIRPLLTVIDGIVTRRFIDGAWHSCHDLFSREDFNPSFIDEGCPWATRDGESSLINPAIRRALNDARRIVTFNACEECEEYA